MSERLLLKIVCKAAFGRSLWSGLCLALGLSIGLSAAAVEGPAELEPGEAYEWQHEKRDGLGVWQYYVICNDVKAAQAFTDDLLDSIESYRKEVGHSVGAHLEFVFPSHLPCQQADQVKFSPLADQPKERLPTLGFGMVYLPADESARATHRCKERPCAFAPVLRQFVRVDLLGESARSGVWLRVGDGINIRAIEQ